MFETPTVCCIVAYEKFNGGDLPRYEFMSSRTCLLSARNYERKLLNELAFAYSNMGSDADGVEVVAYAKADGADEFLDSSYAVIAWEKEVGRMPTQWVGDEIAESIQLW